MLERLAVWLGALAMVVTIAAPVSAEPATDDVGKARELFVEGAKLAEGGKWEEARERFERSLALKRASLTLYNLGVAQQETGKLSAAVETFRAFLAQPVEAATQPFVAPVRGALPKLEARVGHVAVTVRPAGLKGLTVRIDGREVPPAEGSWMVDPGAHEITAGAPGLGEVREATTIAEGGSSALTLSLTPAAAAVAGPRRSLALPATLALGGLALFVGGEIAFTVGALKARHDADDAVTPMIGGNIAAAIGAAAGGVGLYLLLRQPPGASPPKAAITPWFSGSAVGVAGRF